jgi:hypothetical protein
MPLSLEEYGPVWLQPHTLKQGDTTGADIRITGKIDNWHGQEVYAVELTGMQTVIRGTWYYSTKTGILIGCEQAALAADLLNPGGKPAGILLTESNIPGLN